MLEIIKSFFADMYNNCKPNLFVTILSIIQTTILISLFIHSFVYRKSNKKKQDFFNMSGLNQYSSNPVKFNRKSIMMLFFSILSCIFYYLTIDLLCKKKNKNIAWFFSIIIFINLLTQYIYILLLISIFGAMIFYIYKSSIDEDIKDAAVLAGGLGLVLFCIKITSQFLDIFNKKIKNKKANKFWKNIYKYIKGGECNNNGDCIGKYGEGTRCNPDTNLCEWLNTESNDKIDVETKRIMQILGISDESIENPLYADFDHNHDE